MKKLKSLFAASVAVVLSFAGLTVSAANIKLTMNTWENLVNAVAGAAEGSVIRVTPAEGKYGEGEYFEATSTIAITKSLSIVSADKDKPLKIYNGASKLPAFSISSLAGDVTFSEVVFLGADNSTALSPQRGMIDSSADKLYLSYCTFDGCTAGLGTSLKGCAGAVRAGGSLLKVNDCLFRNCRVTKLIDSSISGETTHCAGAVSTTAKEAIFLRCSFIDNEVKGFKNAGGFMGNATPAAIVADHYADTPDAGQPPVLTILKSTFSGNLGASTVFAANSGVRIVNSTFVDNGPATDNPAYGGRAVRYWHSSTTPIRPPRRRTRAATRSCATSITTRRSTRRRASTDSTGIPRMSSGRRLASRSRMRRSRTGASISSPASTRRAGRRRISRVAVRRRAIRRSSSTRRTKRAATSTRLRR